MSIPVRLPTTTTTTTVPPTRRKSLCGYIRDGVAVAFSLVALALLLAVAAVPLVVIGWYIYCEIMSAKSPYLPQFEVESASISQLNTNGSSLTATWDISLLARNPNHKFKIYVDGSFHPEVQYQYIPDLDIKLGSTQLPPFALKVREDKRLNFKVQVVEAYIGDCVAQRISNGMSRGSLRFGVRFNRLPIRVKFKPAIPLVPSFFSPDSTAIREMVCHQLDFKFPGNNGTGVLTSQPQCSIDESPPPCYY